MSSWEEKYNDLREVVDEITLIINMGYSDEKTVLNIIEELKKEAM